MRQLRSLEAAGFASAPQGRRLGTGPRVAGIARNLVSHATLPRLAAPVLAEIAGATGESVYLAEPVDANSAVYVAMEAGSYAIRHVSWLGRSVPRRPAPSARRWPGRSTTTAWSSCTTRWSRASPQSPHPFGAASGAIEVALSLVGPSFRLEGDALAAARQLVANGAATLQSHLFGSAA